MDRKCLIYVETWWPIGQEGYLDSFWLAVFLANFITQPMKSSGDTVENGPYGFPL
jgi:hypothetical protein